MQRIAILLALVLLATFAQASVTFVSPLAGGQALGPQALEITTDAKQVDRVDFSVDGVLAGVARKPPYRIAFDFGTSPAARVVTARVWSNRFQTSESASVTTAALTANDSIDVDLVEVPLRVRSSRALKASDLHVRENGVPQEIRSVRQERPSAHFAFVVDRSLSMGDGKLDAALEAIRGLRGQLRAGDTASIVFFNHHVEEARDLATAGHPVPSGGTSLRDALASVASRQRTYAIVITDGGDRNSALSDEEALRRISGARTVVHALILGSSHTRFLDRAAANTGGTVADATKSSVARELQRVFADINSRYLVVYQSQGTKRGWRGIDVKPRRGGLAIVSARKGYFAE